MSVIHALLHVLRRSRSYVRADRRAIQQVGNSQKEQAYYNYFS